MLGQNVSGTTVLFIFSLIFFALVLFFSLRPAKITVWIGKIINPLFLVFLAILVIAALLNPGTAVSAVEPAAGYERVHSSQHLSKVMAPWMPLQGLH